MKSKKTSIFFPVLTAIFVCASSCASQAPAREDPLRVFLADGAGYVLLPPAGIEKPMDMAQLVSASYGGRDYSFNAWVKADETGLEMALFNELGGNAGELSYREGSVSFSSPVFPKTVNPAYIVADFQLCFYDPVPVGRALNECGLVLETTEAGRRVLKGETVIMEIERSGGAVTLVNRLRGYSYSLEGDFE